MDETITPINEALRAKIQPLIDEAWAGPMIAVNGRLWDTRTLPGFAVLDKNGVIAGYLLFAFHDGECEIMVLESLRENSGIGTALTNAAKEIAKENGLHKLIVMTTNDNLHAIRFYQKRGFTLRALRPNMLETSRRLKSGIPLMSEDGIPLRDEIEFEMEI
ncbi:MAG TPA: GNAT family N-acetyltransferase [Candidatus Limiplasma sp.]|nr:GNAT family N-acetyltransferase [Candidatus Limiplasma sp.]